jgi:hypothetical protein
VLLAGHAVRYSASSIAGINSLLTTSHEFAAVRQRRRSSPAERPPVSGGMLVTNMIRLRANTMTKELIEKSRKRPAFADVALITTAIALVVSIAIAATAVSIGIARADTLGDITQSDGARYALTAFAGLAIAGTGWLASALTRGDEGLSSRD